MRLSRLSRTVLGIVTALILVVVYVPLLVVLVNSFSTSTSLTWPPPGFTLEWWGRAFQSAGAIEAVSTSVQIAAIATLISLILGTLISLALQRFSFFGRDAISLLVILPIALPGIITGIALNNFFRTIMGVPLSIWTVVIAHATFCIVTVFNNVIARLRRSCVLPFCGRGFCLGFASSPQAATRDAAGSRERKRRPERPGPRLSPRDSPI